MSKCVLVREDDEDLALLAQALLEERDYEVITVVDVEHLLTEAVRRSPCVALIDGSPGARFDMWWIGPVLDKLGVPPVAFTAHASAEREFAANPNGFLGVLTKPFDADRFVELVDRVCWEGSAQAAS